MKLNIRAWYRWCLIPEMGDNCRYELPRMVYNVQEEDFFSKYLDEDHIIMLDTGLKDKNWKEIYEWDLIKETDDITYRVFYKDGAFRYVHWNFNPIPLIERSKEEIAEMFEVIGNIYEDMHLLPTDNTKSYR